jgi:cyclophilin family peptidyl-prolyl cis-trans isomerase
MKRFLIVSLLLCVFPISFASADVEGNTEKDLTALHESGRIVFTTQYGDMVFALYPQLAPIHVNKIRQLVKLELYDNIYVARVIDDFVFQFSEIHKPVDQLTAEQQLALQPMKSEFTTQVTHSRGVLSMAHIEGEPDSATSSFSVILGNAEHLDGKYTIFGELESGWTVIDKVLSLSRNGDEPRDRVNIDKAYIVQNSNDYYKTHPKDEDTYVAPKKTNLEPTLVARESVGNLSEFDLMIVIVILIAVNIIFCTAALLFYNKLNKSHLRSLFILIILNSGFTLLIIWSPTNLNYNWLGGVFFILLVAMLRLMSRFEN